MFCHTLRLMLIKRINVTSMYRENLIFIKYSESQVHNFIGL